MSPAVGGWLPAGASYELSLRGGRVIARRASGAELKTLPTALKDHPATTQLRQVRDWLDNHDRACAETVESWMVRSLPVAADLIVAVWPDPAWSTALRNAVVWPVDQRRKPLPDHAGFLGGADPRKGVGLITLEGETTWLHVEAIAIPHPVLMPDLEEYRDFATELGLEQALNQLHRETWSHPADSAVRRVESFGGGRFQQLGQATSRVRALGYSMSGPYAVYRLWDRGQLIEARYVVGSGMPQRASMTGNLEWLGRGGGQPLTLAELGPIPYSEGMRMAARIYAGRVPQPARE